MDNICLFVQRSREIDNDGPFFTFHVNDTDKQEFLSDCDLVFGSFRSAASFLEHLIA